MQFLTYPKVSDLTSFDYIPEELHNITDAIEDALSKIHYTDLFASVSQNGASGFYSLTLLLNDGLGINFPGTDGLSLRLNPVVTPIPNFQTAIPIEIGYNAGLLQFFSHLKISNIAETSEIVFNIFLRLSGANKVDLLNSVCERIIGGTDPAQDFVNKINSDYNPTPVLVLSTNDETKYFDLYQQILRNETDLNLIEIILTEFLLTDSVNDSLGRIGTFFEQWFSKINFNDILRQLIPKIYASISSINVGLEFPLSVLRRIDPTTLKPMVDPVSGGDTKTILTVDLGSLNFSTNSGITFENHTNVDFPLSEILKTGLILQVIDLRFDFSKTTNIPEADADGRPSDFVGVYILKAAIAFPTFWNHNDGESTATVIGRNLLIGTGGISGWIGLQATDPDDPGIPEALFRLGNSDDTGDHFQLALTSFDMQFKQNSIISSDIRGYMQIPGIKDASGIQLLKIDVSVHIGQEGDFNITASNRDGYTFHIPDVADITLRSITIGREDDKWFVSAAGSVKITAECAGISLDVPPIDVKCIKIWQDGSIEFPGGGIALPVQFKLKFGPVSLALSNITFGTHTGMHNSIQRQYSFFGFSGALDTGKGGVAVRGDGIEFHFTKDGLDPKHKYIRIAGIGIDIKLPGTASESQANVLIKGWLGIRPPSAGHEEEGDEYIGGVIVSLKKLHFAGKAAMRLKPKVPAWIVDVEIEPPISIPLATTGLGIYGFRGLLGTHYVADRTVVPGLTEESLWYDYLKAHVPPENQQGIFISKFNPERKGFSVGIGASIGTMYDSGFTFSMKVFVLLSIPEMLLIEGKASLLHQRLGITDEHDPAFYAYLVIDKHSIQTGLGVNFNLPDTGEILALRGEVQMAYFFNNSSAWFINIGKDLPEEKRIQARLLTILSAYSYVMISGKGIKAGAGAKFELKGKYGPVSFGLYAFIDTSGFISFRPFQLGAAMQLGGGLYLKVFGIGIEIYIIAGMSAEAPRPFVIQGFLEIGLKLGFKKIKFRLELVWMIRKEPNKDEVKLIDKDEFGLPGGETNKLPIKAVNMLTDQPFDLYFIQRPGNDDDSMADPLLDYNPATDTDFQKHVVPLDSFVDIEFKHAVKPYKTRYGGGINPMPEYEEKLAPQKARCPQVRHVFSVDGIDIKIWNPEGTGQWEDYDPWEALTAAFQNAGLTVANIGNYDLGYWQYNNTSGKYTSLRLLSQTPFSASNDAAPEGFGMLSQHLLCQSELKTKQCQNWFTQDIQTIYEEGALLKDRNLLMRFTGQGGIGIFPNPFAMASSLKVKNTGKIEIFFNEPVVSFELHLTCLTGATIRWFIKEYADEEDVTISGVPSYTYTQDDNVELDATTLNQVYNRTYTPTPIDKIEIIPNSCEGQNMQALFDSYWNDASILLTNLINSNTLTAEQIALAEQWLTQYFFDPHTRLQQTVTDLLELWQDLVGNFGLSENDHNILQSWIDNYGPVIDNNNPGDYEEETMDSLCLDWTELLEGTDISDWLRLYIMLWKQKYCVMRQISGLDTCSLYVHEVCWLTNTANNLNTYYSGSGSQEAINDDIDRMRQSINEVLSPIWRPHSSYAIVVKTRDRLEWKGEQLLEEYTRTHAFGFRTEGSLGLYQPPLPPAQGTISDEVKEELPDNVDALANLKYYINYQRSYPNADGSLLDAKPLYCENPVLGLFFVQPYVIEFFTKWDAYKGNSAVDYKLFAEIFDPVDTEPDNPAIPAQIIEWIEHNNEDLPMEQPDIQTISNILSQDENNCILNNDVPVPRSHSASVSFELLKPQKQYRAAFKIKEYLNDSSDVNTSAVVHGYTFTTSRYKNIQEHIQSYYRDIKSKNGFSRKVGAIFPILVNFSQTILTAKKLSIKQVITGTLSNSDPLYTNFATEYDRIVYGIFNLQAEQAVTGIEINVLKLPRKIIMIAPGQLAVGKDQFIKQLNNGKNILGIIVKSPEPFNDPKLPAEERIQTIEIQDASGSVATDYSFVFSKDNANIFITNENMSLPAQRMQIIFKYRQFNGKEYEEIDQHGIAVNLNRV